MSDTPRTIDARIQEYLELGGLFNPELMHPAEAVRDLIMDCRKELTASQQREREARDKAFAECVAILRKREQENRRYGMEANVRMADTYGIAAEAIERAAIAQGEKA